MYIYMFIIWYFFAYAQLSRSGILFTILHFNILNSWTCRSCRTKIQFNQDLIMAKERSKCCVCVLFVLLVLGVGLLISGIIVAVLGSFTSLADDEIKKVSIRLHLLKTDLQSEKEQLRESYFILYNLLLIAMYCNI